MKVQSLQSGQIKLLKENKESNNMLESPLRKNKHSYPIDFSSKQKDSFKHPPKKYDVITVDEANPEALMENKSGSVGLSSSSVSELFAQTKMKPIGNSKFQFFSSQQPSNISPNSPKSPIIQNLLFCDQFNSQHIEEPLKEVRKKKNRIIVDQSKLKNPRIQINEQFNIATNQRTLQTISPQRIQKPLGSNVIGGIRHQDFKYFQQFEDQKQPPLHPQKPFNLLHKNIKRNSLLHKLNLSKIAQNSQMNQSYINSEISSARQSFRPQTYTYANRVVASSEDKLEKREQISRANSSFEVKRKDKIIYMNNYNNRNQSFALPDLPPSTGSIGFSKTQQETSLRSKLSNSPHLKLFNNKSHLFNEDHISNQVQFEPNQINKIKAQINLIAKSRFKNRQNQTEKSQQTERQFTFHGSEKNSTMNKQQHSKQVQKPLTRKPTKKLEITYHVPLANLKRICRTYLSSRETYSLAFKVPKIFMQQDIFSRDQSKQQLHENGLLLFESMKINSRDMIIKRYSNCIMFICGHIVVMWYYSGKRYLGGWQYEYLDQGSRHGLGLQWQPDSYIYYGQFRNNKKHGLGAMKEGPEKVIVGYWANGKHIGTAFKDGHQEREEFDDNSRQQNQQDSNNNYPSEDQQYEYPQ